MNKTQEELNQLKTEFEELYKKLKELNEDELLLVTGGTDSCFVIEENEKIYNNHIYTDNDQTFFEPKFNK